MGEATGVQTNEGKMATDDFITRTYVLPLCATTRRATD